MPPKSGNGKLRQTQLTKSTLAKSSPSPMPPPLSIAPSATHQPSTSSPGLAAATRVEECSQQQPIPPPLLRLTAPDEASPSSTAIETTNIVAESETPVRSIRCRNIDGKAPSKLRTVTYNKTQHMVKAEGSKLKVQFSPFYKEPGRRSYTMPSSATLAL